MSSFTSLIASSWSGVSSYRNPSSISRCHGRVRPEGVPRLLAARLVQLHQLARQLLRGLLRPLLRPLPIRPAHAVDGRRLLLATQVLLHPVELVRRHEQLVPRRVLDMQILPLRPRRALAAQAAVHADPVIDMDHVIAGLQVGKGAKRHARRRPPPRRAIEFSPAENLSIRDRRSVAPPAARSPRSKADPRARSARLWA